MDRKNSPRRPRTAARLRPLEALESRLAMSTAATALAGPDPVADAPGDVTTQVTPPADASARPARFTVGLPERVVAGASVSLTVTAVDADGNVLRGYNGRVLVSTLQVAGGTQLASQFDPSATTPVDLVDGVGTTPFTAYQAGQRTLRVASDESAPVVSEVPYTVAAGPFSALQTVIDRAPGYGPRVVEGSRALLVRLIPRDEWGNLVTGQDVKFTVTSTDPRAQFPADLVGQLPQDFDLTDGAGSVYVRFATPGTQSVLFQPVGGTTRTGETVDVQAVTAGRVFRYPGPGGFSPTGPGLAGRTVYIDANNNGRLDDGEVSAVSDSNGDYSLAGIARADAPVRDAGDRSSVFRNNVTLFQDGGDGPTSVALIPTSAVAPLVDFPVFPTDLSDDVTANYVRTLYRAVLDREGSTFEVATWVAGLNAGQTREGVAAQFVNSPEHRRRQVDSYYRTFLGRDADAFSQVWVDRLRSGTSEAEVVASIVASPEYQAAHRDDASFVAALYQDALGRDVDAVGRVDAAAALAGGLSRQELTRRVLGSEEAIDQILDSYYAGYLGRDRDATSSFWVEQLRRPGASASAVAGRFLASGEFFQRSIPVRLVTN